MEFQNIVVFFFFSWGISVLLTPLIIRLAPKFGLVDKPGGRKIHHIPIPRVGGVTLLVSILVTSVLGFSFYSSENSFQSPGWESKLLLILGGTLLAGLLGLADDLMDLRPSVKMIAQALLTGTFALFGYHFEFLRIPGFPKIFLSYFSVPFTALWMMAVMNGFNFMDGVDGLAACVSLVTLLCLGIAATLQGDPSLWILVAPALGALVVFLAYNRPPAKIYMGDMGASLLSFISAAGLISLGQSGPYTLNSNQPAPVLEPFPFQVILCTLLVGYPFLEVFLSTIRRGIKKFYFGRSMEWSEKEHIHHRLLKLGWNAWRIGGVGALFNLLMGVSGLMAMTKEHALAVFCLLPVIVILTFLMPRMGFFDFMDAKMIAGKRSYYLMAHRFLEMQKVKLALVSSSEEVLALASQTCAEFGVQGFWIKAEPGSNGKGGLIYYWERPHDVQREHLQFLKTEIINGDFEVFKDRVALEDAKIEAYWIFEPHTDESDLDVEYRVLVGNFMLGILRRVVEFNRSNGSDAIVQISNLAHARVRSSILRQRYGPKKIKQKLNRVS
jgi:UDP-GlcNAc:undecaprenyl-phosphate GlcNAc-1-phosphate transferase